MDGVKKLYRIVEVSGFDRIYLRIVCYLGNYFIILLFSQFHVLYSIILNLRIHTIFYLKKKTKISIRIRLGNFIFITF